MLSKEIEKSEILAKESLILKENAISAANKIESLINKKEQLNGSVKKTENKILEAS